MATANSAEAEFERGPEHDYELDFGGFLFWPTPVCGYGPAVVVPDPQTTDQPLEALNSKPNQASEASNDSSDSAGDGQSAENENDEEDEEDDEYQRRGYNYREMMKHRRQVEHFRELEFRVIQKEKAEEAMKVKEAKKAKKAKWAAKKAERASKNSIPDDIHPGLRKYWHKRRDLFSKYDEGIKLDHESWYSVTPESIAIHTAKKCALFGAQTVVVDAFCGCGGNTIQFAKICDKVIAIDIDPVKIEYAKHNAGIYGVADKIQFICGDFMELAHTLQAHVVFLSPPWGGPGYSFVRLFNLKTMIPMDGFKVFAKAKEISHNIGYFLPRHIDKDQLDELALANGVKDLEIEANVIRGSTKATTVYFGDLVGRSASASQL